jgi:hypothetical protein
MQWGSQEGALRLPLPRRKGRHRAPRDPRPPLSLRRAGKHETVSTDSQRAQASDTGRWPAPGGCLPNPSHATGTADRDDLDKENQRNVS